MREALSRLVSGSGHDDRAAGLPRNAVQLAPNDSSKVEDLLPCRIQRGCDDRGVETDRR